MENFIEKLKGLDKKVWIGIGIGAAVVIILIVALLIGSGNDKPSGSSQGGSQNNSQLGTQAGTQLGTQAGSEGLGTEGMGTEVGTEMGTEMNTEMGTETEMTESEMIESESQSGTPNNGGSTGNTENTTPQQGTKDTPYMEIPNLDTMTVTTAAVPAGSVLYYQIQRVGGMYLTIEDADAYVITADGSRYDASNGKVSLKIENALSSDFVLFQIGNKSGSAKAFTIKFANLMGTQMNPEVLSGNGPFTKHLNEGDEVGYHYSMRAAQVGKLRIYMSATANTEMNIQNNSGVGTVAASFTGAAQTDDQGRTYVEIAVNAGDDIRIHVQAIKQGRKIPATDITFHFEYN